MDPKVVDTQCSVCAMQSLSSSHCIGDKIMVTTSSLCGSHHVVTVQRCDCWSRSFAVYLCTSYIKLTFLPFSSILPANHSLYDVFLFKEPFDMFVLTTKITRFKLHGLLPTANCCLNVCWVCHCITLSLCTLSMLVVCYWLLIEHLSSPKFDSVCLRLSSCFDFTKGKVFC